MYIKEIDAVACFVLDMFSAPGKEEAVVALEYVDSVKKSGVLSPSKILLTQRSSYS